MPLRRLYTQEFKEDAVRRAKEVGVTSKVANELDINSTMLRRWMKESDRGGWSESGRALNNTPRVPSVYSPTVQKPKDTGDLERLREQVAKLTAERDLLKATLSHYLKG